jgi:hypothetical protein
MRPAHVTPRRLAAALLVGVVALAAPGTARAAFVADSTVNIVSGTPAYGAGSFTGSIAVDNTGPSTSVVRITLTNTTPTNPAGGTPKEYITSIGFSLPSTLTSASLSASPGAPWQLLGSAPFSNNSTVFNTGYFGAFDIGAGIGSTWHTPSGTNPTTGLAPGATGMWEFTLAGPGAAVTAQSLLTQVSTNGSPGIGVRFRYAGDVTINGAAGGKVLAVCAPTPPDNPPGAVPAPAGLVLALAGVGTCLLGRGFRRRLTAKAE